MPPLRGTRGRPVSALDLPPSSASGQSPDGQGQGWARDAAMAQNLKRQDLAWHPLATKTLAV